MRGLFQYLQHFTRIGGYLIYLEPTLRMEREFNYNFHQCHGQCIGWDHFSEGQQLMRFQRYKYPECLSHGNSCPAGFYQWFLLGMCGFIRDLQHIAGIRSYLLYLDPAIGMERQFELHFDHCYSRCIRWDDIGQGQQLLWFW